MKISIDLGRFIIIKNFFRFPYTVRTIAVINSRAVDKIMMNAARF